ncbi:hypothetical protein T484DRAFT_1742853 [Baffinella frigidus]|nr:hypothetical protein T484DRAFT_1742853 [Cryptophyta sp. CCMP2293]
MEKLPEQGTSLSGGCVCAWVGGEAVGWSAPRCGDKITSRGSGKNRALRMRGWHGDGRLRGTHRRVLVNFRRVEVHSHLLVKKRKVSRTQGASGAASEVVVGWESGGGEEGKGRERTVPMKVLFSPDPTGVCWTPGTVCWAPGTGVSRVSARVPFAAISGDLLQRV